MPDFTPENAVDALVAKGFWFWFDGNGSMSGQWMPSTISRNADGRTPEQQIQFNEMARRFCGSNRMFHANAVVTLKYYVN